MPTVSRRRVADEDAPRTTRRRDRARAAEEDDVEEDDDEEEPPRRPRKAAAAKKTTRRRTTRAREPEPEPEEDEDDEEEDEEPEEDDDDEEEEPPRRSRRSTAKKASGTRKRSSRRASDDDIPQGLHVGLEGAETVTKSGGGGMTRLTLTKEPELIKALQDAPFVSFKQHWVKMGGGQGDRPYACLEEDCPLCEMGDIASKVYIFNVLHLSSDDGKPSNKILQLGVKAYNSFKAQATPRNKDKPVFDRDYWAVSRSGKNQSSQTNFSPVKDRDLEEDWDEIFEKFEPDDLPEMIEEAKEHLLDYKVIQVQTRKQLRDVARHLSEDDDEDDDE